MTKTLEERKAEFLDTLECNRSVGLPSDGALLFVFETFLRELLQPSPTSAEVGEAIKCCSEEAIKIRESFPHNKTGKGISGGGFKLLDVETLIQAARQPQKDVSNVVKALRNLLDDLKDRAKWMHFEPQENGTVLPCSNGVYIEAEKALRAIGMVV